MKAQLLGKGSFGAAFLATSKRDGKKYVLKEIDISRMQKKEREAAEQEAKVPFHVHVPRKLLCNADSRSDELLSLLLMLLQVLQALHHPNIVSCKEAFTCLGKLIIVMDYCSEGVHLPSCIHNADRLAYAFASGIQHLLNGPRLIKRKPSCRLTKWSWHAGDLCAALKKRAGALLQEPVLLDWFVQLLLGLKHVHDRNILHR